MINHRDIFNSKLEQIELETSKYFKDAEDFCKGLDVSSINSLSQFSSVYSELESKERVVRSVTINFDVDSIKKHIDRVFDLKIKVEEDKNKVELIALQDKIELEISNKTNLLKEKNKDIRDRNNLIIGGVNSANSVYDSLIFKQQSLLEYSKDIIQICLDYGIKVSDINLNLDMFTIDEFNVFYDEFNSFIQARSSHHKNPIEFIRDKVNDNTIALAIILLSVFILSFTPVLDILSVALLLYLMYTQMVQESLVKKYTILAGLAFQVNFNDNKLDEDSYVDKLESEVEEIVDVDSDDSFKPFIEELDSVVNSLENNSAINEKSIVLSAFVTDYNKMQEDKNKVLSKIEEYRNNILSMIKVCREELDKRNSILKSEVMMLGSSFNEERVLNTNVKLGIDKETLIYETIDIGIKNIIFKESGNSADDIDSFIKVLLVNMYCNVRPGYLQTIVYDPNGLGRSLAGFYNKEFESAFELSNKSLDVILTELREYTERVLKITKGATINEYNQMCVKTGKLALEYKLLIVLSQPKTVEENEALRSFIGYSANLGVFIWMISDFTFPNTLVFNKPFQNINNPIEIDRFNFPIEVVDNLFKCFSSMESPGLDWTVVKDKVIPDENIWCQNADEFIELNPGFEDGDSSKYKSYTLGNVGDIHMLIVGGTGSGKSVYINNLIITIARKYSPKDVGIVLVDFKGNEFSFYLKNPAIGRNYILPHIEACLCTSDPDYSVSLFSAIRDETDARFKDLKQKGYKNIYSYNKAMRKNGTPELIYKRKIFIVDEFQVIFEKTSAKAQSVLKADIKYIASLGRAAGIHLVFASQSMTGTVDASILNQFTLRSGLRCSMEVSQAIMGTKLPGSIRERNGYLYMASVDDKKAEDQRLFRTPFISDEILLAQIEYLAKRAVLEGIPYNDVIEYDETTVHDSSELVELYETSIAVENRENLIVLGNKMVYSDLGKRSKFFLERENNEHIFASFSDTIDYVNFFKTLMLNIKYNNKVSMIFNTQENDIAYLCGVDEYVDSSNEFFYNEDMTPNVLLGFIQKIVDGRATVGNINELEPLYIFLLGWDKSIGFGIDVKYPLTDKFSTLLQTSAKYHIHFIFLTSSKAEIPKTVINACKHRIAGRCDSATSTALIESEDASKIYEQKNGYMFYNTRGVVERVKIYKSDVTRFSNKKILKI